MRLRLILAAFLAISTAPAVAQNPAVRLMPPNVTNVAGQPMTVPLVNVLDYEDGQVLAGNGYTVGTNVVSVASGNYLYFELANPAGSGLNYIITSRAFASNIAGGGAPLEYARYPSASVISATPTPTSVTINNRIAGGPASTGTFRFAMSSTLPTGTASSSGFLITGGEELRIKEIIVLPPGARLIYAIGGSGGGLAAAARIKATVLFYTTPA